MKNDLQTIGIKPAQIRMIEEAITKSVAPQLKAVTNLSTKNIANPIDIKSSTLTYRPVIGLNSKTTAKPIESQNNNNDDDIVDGVDEYLPSYLSLINEITFESSDFTGTERELSKLFETVTKGLSNNEDWQMRINALILLQKLTLDETMMNLESFLINLKTCTELVSQKRRNEQK